MCVCDTNTSEIFKISLTLRLSMRPRSKSIALLSKRKAMYRAESSNGPLTSRDANLSAMIYNYSPLDLRSSARLIGVTSEQTPTRQHTKLPQRLFGECGDSASK